MPLFFTATVSVRESEGDAVEYRGNGLGKERIIYIVYINGKKFAGERNQSLFPGARAANKRMPRTSA